ncbi:MAG TPA: hypothetical protein V6D34_19305 [Candidatus Sericytochromatia bacterium]
MLRIKDRRREADLEGLLIWFASVSCVTFFRGLTTTHDRHCSQIAIHLC